MATIGLLGTGKTGGRVEEVASNHTVIGFNEANKPTLEALKACDVVIVFLPGDVFEGYIDLLVEAGRPVVTGATGVSWPDGMHERLLEQDVVWVTASNFALGMNIVRAMIAKIAAASKLFEDAKYAIHEVHHTQKVDAPSGTALSWHEWLDAEADITSERTGDVVGEHSLTLDTKHEKISIHHSAKDRSIFAAGAVWVAEWVLAQTRTPGLHKLEDVMKQELEL